MRRASVSARANIAEGYGQFHFKEGTRQYRIARGSLYDLRYSDAPAPRPLYPYIPRPSGLQALRPEKDTYLHNRTKSP